MGEFKDVFRAIEKRAMGYARATGQLIAACDCAGDDVQAVIERQELSEHDAATLRRALKALRYGVTRAQCEIEASGGDGDA